MPYTARLRTAVGAVRACLQSLGLDTQSARFTEHGEHQPDSDAPLVMVACSGGRDSIALAAVSGIVCASLGLRCGAAIIDHGLQSGSDIVANETMRRCTDLGLHPVIVQRVSVDATSGNGIEAAARAARYQALEDIATRNGSAVMLLAHTKNDQAETVLIDVLRSGGTDALAGMPAISVRNGVRFARPLLSLSREDTGGICHDLNLEWWDDPTNGDHMDPDVPLPDDYPLRSRIRHTLLPFIEHFAGGDMVSKLSESARLAAIDKDYLDQCCDEVTQRTVTISDASLSHSLEAQRDPSSELLSESSGKMLHKQSCEEPNEATHNTPHNTLHNTFSTSTRNTPNEGLREILRFDVHNLEGEHQAIRLRVIAHALAAVDIEVSSRHIEAIDRLITDWHGQGPVSLPSGYSANRRKHVIRVCQDSGHENRRCSRANRP